jgi:hypothetical protein
MCVAWIVRDPHLNNEEISLRQTILPQEIGTKHIYIRKMFAMR